MQRPSDGSLSVIITAAGSQERWGRSLPKQLVPVCGEPLLHRTINQLRARDVEPTVVTHDKRLNGLWETFNPQERGCLCETINSSSALWKARTIVLLGDVCFSPWALDTILNNRDPIRVFGRKELHYRLSGRYYELFAMSFDFAVWSQLIGTLRSAIDNTRFGRLRDFYELWCGLPLGEYKHEDRVFYPIEDWTEDFDAYEDYVQFTQMIIGRGWCRASSECS